MNPLPIGWWLIPLDPNIRWKARIVHSHLEPDPDIAVHYPFWCAVHIMCGNGSWSLRMEDQVAVRDQSQFRLCQMTKSTYGLWDGVESGVDLELRLDPPEAQLVPGESVDLFAEAAA